MKFLKKIITRLFCGHLQWTETGHRLDWKLNEYKCAKCGKVIYRDYFNPPRSF